MEKTYLVTDIEYDTDGLSISLPEELTIVVPSSCANDAYDTEDYISDEISNITGFCHYGFSMKLISGEWA